MVEKLKKKTTGSAESGKLKKDFNSWLKMSEWGRQNGMTCEGVRKAVAAGRLETNGEKGRLCRVRGPLLDSANSATGHDLITLKQKKLAADIQLVEQRIEERRREWETVMADKTIAAFIKGFTPFKAELAALRLGVKETEKLNHLFDVCIANFETELRKDNTDLPSPL